MHAIKHIFNTILDKKGLACNAQNTRY